MKHENVKRRRTLFPACGDRRSSEHMTRVILLGSLIINVLLLFWLLLSILVLEHEYIVERICIGVTILLYLLFAAYLIHKNRIRLVAWMMVVLYGAIGLFILYAWGINAPLGVLALGFVIFLTSIVLGLRHVIVVTITVIVSLMILQSFDLIGSYQADQSMLSDHSTFGHIALYSIIFCIFALIAWISSRKMEYTLERALKAESELQKERNALATRVHEQTKSINNAQQKELKQLYKFAELGQLTTIILHELANYLSILTLDIDDLEDRHQNSLAIAHAKESIFYIDNMIDQVRNQLKDSDNSRTFNAREVAKETIKQLHSKLQHASLSLFVEETTEQKQQQSYTVYGDPLRLSQAITILVTNAAQAHTTKPANISIEVSATKRHVTISVKDFGKGVPERVRKILFKLQKSTKTTGLGIGLYVTKQIIETHFKGKIWLNPSTAYTQFTIEIPKSKRS